MRETMTALRFDGALRLEEMPVPTPGPGEALIEIIRAGICSTDREIVRGYLGFSGTLGHEFVGRVVAYGPAAAGGSSAPPSPAVGARVVGEINLPCRHCPACAAGAGNHCPNRRVLGIVGKDGTFARYITLPVANLHLVPDNVDDRRAVFVEPLAAALRIVEQLQSCGRLASAAMRRALVIGDGKLGLLSAMVLSRVGLDVAIAGRHAHKLEIARAQGIDAVSTEDGGREFDVVVEASGSPSGWELAMQRVRPQGIVVLKSTTHEARPWNTAPLVIDEVTVFGSRCGPFPTALEWLAEARVDPLLLLEAELPLVEGLHAFVVATKPGALKVQLIPEGLARSAVSERVGA